MIAEAQNQVDVIEAQIDPELVKNVRKNLSEMLWKLKMLKVKWFMKKLKERF